MLPYVVLIATVCLVSATRPESAKDRLTHDLLKNYQPGVDPGIIELEFALSFTCSRFDHHTGTVVSSVWEQHYWKDTRLTWNPSEYGGVELIRVPASHIWTPDTRLYNSISALVERDDVNAVVYSDGRVLWIPRATYRTLCQHKEDEISCKVKIGSWTYDGNNVALKAFGKDPINLDDYSEDCPAVIASHKAEVVSHKYPCCEEPYPSLDATFTLKPRHGKFATPGKHEL